jgi:hypothetical protein
VAVGLLEVAEGVGEAVGCVGVADELGELLELLGEGCGAGGEQETSAMAALRAVVAAAAVTNFWRFIMSPHERRCGQDCPNE